MPIAVQKGKVKNGVRRINYNKVKTVTSPSVKHTTAKPTTAKPTSKSQTTRSHHQTAGNRAPQPAINAKKLRIITAIRAPDTGVKQEPPKYTEITGRPPVCYYAKQGPRESMEDTFQIMHFKIGGVPGTFYGVFDGHGGKDVSYELVHATNGLFPFLIKNIEKTKGKNIPQVIKASYLQYDKSLFDRKFNAGSTAIVVLNFAGKLYLINLGDSRGMIFTKDELIAVSDDHKPQKPKERNRIYRAGHFVTPFTVLNEQAKTERKRYNIGDVYVSRNQAYIYLGGSWEPITGDQYKQIQEMNTEVDTNRVSNSLALSRAFADNYLKADPNGKYTGFKAAVSPEPDITVIDLAKYRKQEIHLFLASDGFWDVNRNTSSLRTTLGAHPNPQDQCRQLVDSSLEKGSMDNTTVVYDRFVVQ